MQDAPCSFILGVMDTSAPTTGPKAAEMTHVGDHAVVLGASLAGLAAAAALAERFDRVTIVERDTLPQSGECRRGIPQGRHVHILLPAGLMGLSDLLPGIVEDLRARDARLMDTTEVRFHIADGSLLLDDADLEFVGATRPLLESVVRDRVRSLPGVQLLERQDARGLLTTPDRSTVTGVRLGSPDSSTDEALAGDLVVDATGRSSRSPRWVADLGYPSPDEQRLDVGIHYTTRLFHRQPGDLEGCQNLVVTIPQDGSRGGVVLAVEGDRWIVTLIGLTGERPPADLDGFIEYARTLWVDDLHDLVAAAEPLGEASTGGFPSYLRHRYDRLRQLPQSVCRDRRRGVLVEPRLRTGDEYRDRRSESPRPHPRPARAGPRGSALLPAHETNA